MLKTSPREPLRPPARSPLARLGLGVLVAFALVLVSAPAADAFVYWTNYNVNGTIGRAETDGTGANQSFITGVNGPYGVAVDGSHVYWGNLNGNTIGRADLDGSNPNQSFIGGASSPRGLAVDGAHLYWANQGSNTIGRADLDGSNPNQSFINGAKTPFSVAVD